MNTNPKIFRKKNGNDWNFGDIFVIYKSCKMIIIYVVYVCVCVYNKDQNRTRRRRRKKILKAAAGPIGHRDRWLRTRVQFWKTIYVYLISMSHPKWMMPLCFSLSLNENQSKNKYYSDIGSRFTSMRHFKAFFKSSNRLHFKHIHTILSTQTRKNTRIHKQIHASIENGKSWINARPRFHTKSHKCTLHLSFSRYIYIYINSTKSVLFIHHQPVIISQPTS